MSTGSTGNSSYSRALNLKRRLEDLLFCWNGESHFRNIIIHAYIVQFMKLRCKVSLVVRVRYNLGLRSVQCQGQTVMTTRKHGLRGIQSQECYYYRVYTIICLKSVVVRKLQIKILARTDRIV